jgi:hypothetical protein
LAIVFAALALVPVAAAIRAAADSSVPPPGNFPVNLIALIALVLAGTAVAWLLQSRGPNRVGRWMIVFGGLLGLLLGLYGIYGTAALTADCAEIEALRTTAASSFPADYCDRIGGSLLIGYYMIAVGVASAVSLGAFAWISQLRRSGDHPSGALT